MYLYPSSLLMPASPPSPLFPYPPPLPLSPLRCRHFQIIIHANLCFVLEAAIYNGTIPASDAFKLDNAHTNPNCVFSGSNM